MLQESGDSQVRKKRPKSGASELPLAKRKKTPSSESTDDNEDRRCLEPNDRLRKYIKENKRQLMAIMDKPKSDEKKKQHFLAYIQYTVPQIIENNISHSDQVEMVDMLFHVLRSAQSDQT